MTRGHGPDDGVLFTETLDVLPDDSEGEFAPWNTAAAFGSGVCSFERASVGSAPLSPPDPWKAGVQEWGADASTRYVGTCGGPLREITAGIATFQTGPTGGGMLLVAPQRVTSEEVGVALPRDSGWAISADGHPRALFRSSALWSVPSPGGLVWSVDDKEQLWRVDASSWLR